MGEGKRFYAHTPGERGAWHDLVSHPERTAEAAEKNAAKFRAGELGRLAGLWHDVGKFNLEFQEYLGRCYEAKLVGGEAPRGGSVPHAVYGAMLASEKNAAEAVEWLVPVVYGHHAGLLDHDTYGMSPWEYMEISIPGYVRTEYWESLLTGQRL
jgi:CRISPR-associated endonuclease/helicase Cas3